jgi:hypothetical protein
MKWELKLIEWRVKLMLGLEFCRGWSWCCYWSEGWNLCWLWRLRKLFILGLRIEVVKLGCASWGVQVGVFKSGCSRQGEQVVSSFLLSME